MSWIEIGADDGHRLAAWRAEPEGEARGGVLVVQEIFGVNEHIRDVADRFARAGYLAVAPAIFDRIERGIELGYDEAGVARGRSLAGELDQDAMLGDLAAGAREAGKVGAVGAVGYCFGGAATWVAAARMENLACAVSYYGSRIVNFMDQAPRVPVMMHVGQHDLSFPMEKVRELGARYPEVAIFEYDAGHGFNCDRRGDFAPEAAALALERTLAFFGEHVG